MKITIIGSGNIGTLLAGQFSQKKYQVTLFTRKLSVWNGIVEVYDEDDGSHFSTKVYKITDDYEEAVKDADMIIFTLPAFAIKTTIKNIESFVKTGTYLLFYPGTGGGEFYCSNLLKKGCIIMGTQRVCSVVRLNEYGKTVTTSGKRPEMFISSIPNNKGEEVRKLFESLFEVKTILLPNYLNVTLTPSNPILHTARLYSIFKDYYVGKIYSELPLFYQDWDEFSANILINCDNELHNILSKLDKFDTSLVKPLLRHYESSNAQELTNKIRSIESFKGLVTPNIVVEGGFIPNLESRYFTADFPYGLVIIKAFALICKVKTPCIDEVLNWYQNIVNKEYITSEGYLGKDSVDLPLPQNFGIDIIEKIYSFYG